MAIELAAAYVSIVPSFKGGAGALSKQLGGPLEQASSEAGGRAGKGFAGKFGGAFKGLATGLATTFAAVKVGDFIGDTISAASDLSETTSKVQVVFGDAAQGVLDFGKNSATALGQSKNEALAAAGTFGNLLRAVGLNEQESAKFSTSMVTLASDLASFNNTSPTDALDALRAGLVGETEPLKRFGVNLNEATLKAKAMELGLSDGKGTLDANAKAQAAYALIMEQTSLAQGDFARTSDGLANKQRIMGAQIENLKARIGSALLPVVTKITAAFVTFTDWVGRHLDIIKPLAVVIGGALVGAFYAWASAAIAAAAPTIAAAAPVLAIGAAVAALAYGILYLAENWSEVWPKIKQVAADAVDAVIGFLQDLPGRAAAAFTAVGSTVAEFAPVLAEKLRAMGAALVAWVADAIPPLLLELGKLLVKMTEWIVVTAVPKLVTEVAKIAAEFVNWVAPAIPPLLVELGKLLADVVTWIVTEAIPKLVTQLAGWALEFVKWVGPAIPDLILELGKLYVRLEKWMLTEALPKIVTQLAEWAGAFIGWVWKAVRDLPANLATLLKNILDWAKDVPGKIIEKLGDLAQMIWDAFIELGGKAADAFISGLGNIAARVAAKIGLGGSPAERRFREAEQRFGGNAHGTPAWRGGWTWVGEEGPELVNLPRGTAILPNPASMALAADIGRTTPLVGNMTVVVDESVDLWEQLRRTQLLNDLASTHG